MFRPLLCFAFAFCFPLFSIAQITLQYQNPDSLFVCGEDTFFIKINNAGAAITNATLQLDFPNGLEYVPNSVTGATEQNLSNPIQIEFEVNIAANASHDVAVLLSPKCPLVSAANMGQLFFIGIEVDAGVIQQSVQTTTFQIETGLLVLLAPTPNLSGEKGDVLTREIRIQNTRIGKVGSIRFQDEHGGGISVSTPDLGGSYIANNLWEATIDGAFISQFGNGDEWLDEDEILVFEEKISIDSCADNDFDVGSQLRSLWGCDLELCQYDSLMTDVEVIKSTINPDLVFTPTFQYHRNECSEEPSVQHLLIENIGQSDAENLVLTFRDSVFIPPQFSALDGSSFEINTGQGWQTLVPNVVTDAKSTATCGMPFRHEDVTVVVPLIPKGGNVEIRFNQYVCADGCGVIFPFYDIFSFYLKPCPVNNPVSDSLRVGHINITRSDHLMAYDFMDCLQEGESQALDLGVSGPLLALDTGYLKIVVSLNFGLEWDSTCTPILDGKSPVFSNTYTNNGNNVVELHYELPFSDSLLQFPFCVKYTDCEVIDTCLNSFGNLDVRGGDLYVYAYDTLDCPKPCGLEGGMVSSIVLDQSDDLLCGLSACSDFLFFVNNPCDTSAFSIGDTTNIPSNMRCQMETNRINYGFRDDNDDRIADDMSPPDLSLIRRDRYLSSDTLRLELDCVVTSGMVNSFSPQVFHEMIQSDQSPFLDGDNYDLVQTLAQGRFTNFDNLRYIGGSLRVYRADGTTETCPFDLNTRQDQHSITLLKTNINPPRPDDYLVSMWHQFSINSAMCGSGQPFEEGDSLVFLTDYELCTNYAINEGDPSLINFRTTLPRKKVKYAYKNHPLNSLSQYSNYVDSLSFPRYNIRICDPSQEVSPLYYKRFIARENLFPFEVRPLTRYSNFTYEIPNVLELESALNDVFLQEGIVRLSDIPFTWTRTNDVLNINTDPVFDEIIDEGFEIYTHFTWKPTCDFPEPDTATISLGIGLPNCFFPNIDTLEWYHPLGFLSGTPSLVLVGDTILELNSPNLNLDLLLKNNKSINAPNSFLYAQPVNGNFTGQQFIDQANNIALPQTGGVSQNGQMPLFSQQNFILQGQALNCDPFFLDIIYGYNCTELTNPAIEACGQDTLQVEIRLLETELELNINQQPPTVPMCTPSDFFVFEVKNAKFGRAFDVNPLVKLPQGLDILSGSCEISYPIGAPFVQIVDPNALANNNFVWNFSDILTQLNDGLPGVDEDPANTFQIRFKVLAECGFVSNEQPVYGVDGKQPCGAETNSIRKAGNPLLLDGLQTPPEVLVSLQGPSTPQSCGDQSTWAVSVQVQQGSTGNLDSVYIEYPNGFSYVNNSYVAGQNAPANISNNTGDGFVVKLTSGLTSGEQMAFDFDLIYNIPNGCVDDIVTASVRQVVTAFCPMTNMDCDVFQSSGQAVALIQTAHPELVVSLQSVVADGSGAYFDIENIGGALSNGVLEINFYKDVNGDGVLTTDDDFLSTYTGTLNLPNGANQLTLIPLPNGTVDLCGLLVEVVGASICACEDKVFLLQTVATIDQGLQSFCGLQDVDLGLTMPTQGHAFSWSGPSMIWCASCPNTVFEPDPNTNLGDVLSFTLEETGQNCTFIHQFEVQFLDDPEIATADQSVCRGESITLQASISAGQFEWSGPGITNANQATQTIFPQNNATYTLTATSPEGCTGTDMVQLTVLQSDSSGLAPVTTCEGIAVDVQGTLTDQAGVYCRTFQNQFGCDSLICQELLVVPNTAELIEVCAGEMADVFGQMVAAGNTVCQSFQSSFGCDSTHCISVEAFQPPVIPQPDTLFALVGETITLQGPDGFAVYAWSPDSNLTCSDCQSPMAIFTKTGLYTFNLQLETTEGCSDSLIYRILVSAPCDLENVVFPNAFTPGDGDGTNDTFNAILPIEGTEQVLSMLIYNRWGEKIYANSGPNLAWDGTKDGTRQASDVYVYIAEITCPDGTIEQRKGNVTLLR